MEFVSLRKKHLPEIPFWSIPMIYSGTAIVLGLVFPHLEYRYLKGFDHGVTTPLVTALFLKLHRGMLVSQGSSFPWPLSCCSSVAQPVHPAGFMAWS